MLQDIASIKKLHDYRISTTIIQSPCFTNLRPYCLYYPSVTGYGPIKVANARQKRLVVCWLNNARNSLPGLAERGRVGHLPKMGDEPCVVESPKNFS